MAAVQSQDSGAMMSLCANYILKTHIFI